MKLNQKLIKQLRNGEIAVENNGTLEQLREVLKEAFPEDKFVSKGTSKLYKANRTCIAKWGATDSTTLPVISVSDFYQSSQVKKKSTTLNYLIDDMEYSLDYQELKAKYEAVVSYSDDQFMDNLHEIAHLACIISYFKGLSNNATIGDKGIVHELIHLMTDPYEPLNDLQEIRKSFNEKIKLV